MHIANDNLGHEPYLIPEITVWPELLVRAICDGSDDEDDPDPGGGEGFGDPHDI